MVEKMKNVGIENEDLLFSFNIVSLFTTIFGEDAIKVISEITDEDTTKLIKIYSKLTYFSFWGCLYEQIEGMVMGSPLSLVVANLYMENFEKTTIDSYPMKPKLWKRYVDDTHVIWPHGR
jgi:hypothetical protein